MLKPAISVLWLEAGSGSAPAGSGEQFCFRCGKFAPVVNAICTDCIGRWKEEYVGENVPGHERKVTRTYWISYPEHAPREDDPHYRDFEEYRRRTKDTAQCARGLDRGDFSECSLDKPLELHHAHIEFSLANAVDLSWLEKAYPGVSDPDQVGAWVESADNLLWLCERCHRSAEGVHNASASDWEAEKFVRNLIREAP